MWSAADHESAPESACPASGALDAHHRSDGGAPPGLYLTPDASGASFASANKNKKIRGGRDAKSQQGVARQTG